MASNTFGERYEKKFVVSLDKVRGLVLDRNGEFCKLFEFDYIQQDSLYNIVDSVYFESPDLTSYHEHLEGKQERVKIRLRQYNPDGLPEGITFFEIKEKRENKTFKARVVIKPEWLRPFLVSGDFPEELYLLNASTKAQKVQDAMRSLKSFVMEQKYVPMLRCTYMRHAYKLRSSDKVRVTMDRDFRFVRLFYSTYPRHAYPIGLDANDIIVEVKMSQPDLTELIPKFEEMFGTPTSISKFCYGIYQTRDRYLIENRDWTLSSLQRYQKVHT